MEDDETISGMLQAVKRKKKSTKDDKTVYGMPKSVQQKKKSMKKMFESSPSTSTCCRTSPDPRDLQVVSGLLNLQSTPDHPQERKQKHDISTQQISPQSSPVHERRSEPDSIARAGRERARKCEERHINSDHLNGNGCLHQSKGSLGHNESFGYQPNMLQENCASSQSYRNDPEEISSKDQLILSASKSKNKKMNRAATEFALCRNSDLHSGRECDCQKTSQDPRSHKNSIGQNEAGDVQQSIEGVKQLDRQEICTTSAEDNETEPHCQWDKLSKRIETFASEANILQEICGDKGNLEIGKRFVLDEEKREFIAQEMARSCRNDASLRHIFLESLNELVEGGLLQSVALKVLSEGPCEAAQEVIDILEKRRTEPNSAQHLIALLHAVENVSIAFPE